MTATTITHKLIESHMAAGRMKPGEEIGVRIDQTLTQDATGTLAMLIFESMGVERTRAETSAQYVDHNLLEEDYKNADDHQFLYTASRRFGTWLSRAGNGVSHPVHMQRLGRPGASLLGSDSHTCAAGALGMLAFGAGGLDVAAAMAGQPYYLPMPEVWGVHLVGQLPRWVSAKDVILEMLRRHGVAGGVGRIIEYGGPGVATLSAMDRHVIANMGAELGATTTVFPSDDRVRQFLAAQDRQQDWRELRADPDARYAVEDEIDLSSLEPLVATPSSPGNVVPVRTLAGEPIYQAYIGSSANPGYRDFAIAAEIVRDRHVAPTVSFDVNPTSRQLLVQLASSGLLAALVEAGARIHQTGCNGCIGMGQAPATRGNSLRTVPRNFPGRSGTADDRVFLASPETVAASALRGVITDPRELGIPYPDRSVLEPVPFVSRDLLPPLDPEEAAGVELVKGPNIATLPGLEPLPDSIELPVELVVGDDISTDEILPAGARVLPLRSNIPAIAQFCFAPIDEAYVERARRSRENGGHAVVAGTNYGQGSSREHAALAPRFLGLRVVLARSFARIHWQNLVNFGVLPLELPEDGPERLSQGDVVRLAGLHSALSSGDRELVVQANGGSFRAHHQMSSRQCAIVLAGGQINAMRGGAS